MATKTISIDLEAWFAEIDRNPLSTAAAQAVEQALEDRSRQKARSSE